MAECEFLQCSQTTDNLVRLVKWSVAGWCKQKLTNVAEVQIVAE